MRENVFKKSFATLMLIILCFSFICIGNFSVAGEESYNQVTANPINLKEKSSFLPLNNPTSFSVTQSYTDSKNYTNIVIPNGSNISGIIDGISFSLQNVVEKDYTIFDTTLLNKTLLITFGNIDRSILDYKFLDLNTNGLGEKTDITENVLKIFPKGSAERDLIKLAKQVFAFENCFYVFDNNVIVKITTKDEHNRAIATKIEQIAKDSSFDKSTNFVFKNNKAYYLRSNQKIVCYDVSASTESILYPEQPKETNLRSFDINGDNLFFTDGTSIFKYDLKTKAVINKYPEVDIISGSIEELHCDVANGKIKITYSDSLNNSIVVLEENENNNLVYKAHYGTNGSEIDRLNAPTSSKISSDETMSAVCDPKNSRVMVYKMQNENQVEEDGRLSIKVDYPQFVSFDQENNLYIFNNKTSFASGEDNEILIYTKDLKLKSTIKLSSEYVLADFVVAKNGVIYFTSGKSIYTMTAANTYPYQILQLTNNPIAIDLSYNEKNIYIASSTRIEKYNLETKKIEENATFMFADYKINLNGEFTDFTVDYKGGIYIVVEDTLENKNSATIKYYKHSSENKFALTSIYKALSTLPMKKVIDLQITNSGNMYCLNTFYHTYIHFENITVPTKMAEFPKKSEWNIEKGVGAISIDKTQLFSTPNNYEDMIILPKNTLFLTLKECVIDKINYNFGIDAKGNFGYILSSAISYNGVTKTDGINTDMTQSAKALNINGLNIYQFPFENIVYKNGEYKDDNICGFLDKNSVVTIIDNVAVFNGEHAWQNEKIKWYKVKYTNEFEQVAEGYVRKFDIAPATTIKAPISNKKLTVSATKAGEKINMYVLPDTAAGVIAQLNDSQIVYLLDDKLDLNNGFTKVKLVAENGVELQGYILTVYLSSNILTSMQISIIVICSILFVATLAITIILTIKRKSKGSSF